ncbi:PPC domain-containing protein [uncultured Pontibacter sp.]|uniref:PPC domain-containing protein n=1 Tax=uncultured Pontibacter sp. TaxID=453356 RepID=UPI002606E985|nr:PPC domain-containing protein [uncultured Pontibacter sp.]
MKKHVQLLLLLLIGFGLNSCELINDAFEEALDFEGIFESPDGMVIEAIGDNAYILKVGKTTQLGKTTLRVGNPFMVGVKYRKSSEDWSAITYTSQGEAEEHGFSYDGNSIYVYHGPLALRNWARTNTRPSTGGSTPSTGTPSTGTPTGGNITLLDVKNIEGALNSTKTYKITVPSGTKKLEVVLSGLETGGRPLSDLFVRRGQAPVINRSNGYSWTADCASVNPNYDDEVCIFNNPSSGEWYLTVYGYHAYWGANLKAVITK